jgi:hypothetical protein
MGPWEEGRQCRERVWLGVILRMCMHAACMAVRVSIDMGIQMHTLSEVISWPLFPFIPCKDFINTYEKKIFFRRSERQRDFKHQTINLKPYMRIYVCVCI